MSLSRFFELKFLLPALLICSIFSIFIGVKNLTFSGLLARNLEDWELLLITRVPRLIAIIITGASLSLCGLIMQQITQNKFVSPTTAGTMDCARLGILVVSMIFVGSSFLFQAFMASCFALFGSLVFLQILRKIRLKDVIFVPLVGLMFGGIVSAGATFFAYSFNYIQSIQGWLQGSFSNIMQGNYELIYIALPLFFIAFLFANKITIVGMGEDVATNLGVSYNSILMLGLIIVSIITSIVVISIGIIPFLGLIIPNLVSIYRGDNLRKNLFYISIVGALFLLVCDIFSRLIIFPFEMPISITTGVIGSFIFILLLLKKKYA